MPLDPAKLKSRRERLNLTQQQVADAAELQRSYIARLEGGYNPSGSQIDPPLSIVERMASALRCPIKSLLSREAFGAES